MSTAYVTRESPEAAVLRVPLHALDGGDCGPACEICPLRTWKSRAMTNLYCRYVLESHRLLVEAIRQRGGSRFDALSRV